MVRSFSEREGHVVPRDREELGDVARNGIGALIRASVGSDAFAQSFPVRCHRCTESQIVNTDESSFWAALEAVTPEMGGWPKSLYLKRQLRDDPATMSIIFDSIEFCWQNVARPGRIAVNPSFRIENILRFDPDPHNHVHITFDQAAGRKEFRTKIEDIFRRNGIAYKLTATGRVERILPPELDALVHKSEFHTSDDELDRLLDTARAKFLDPDFEVRREALEALWDGWERLKTMGSGNDKKEQTKAMLDEAAGGGSPTLRDALEEDARQLTNLGNDLRIRHSEKTKEMLAMSEHLDYLFLRMFSLIWMILRQQKLVGVEA